MAEEVFQPGDRVAAKGVYQVLHYRHRLSHEVTIFREQTFPRCSECGNNLRFRLVRAAPPLEDDRNFVTKKSHGAS